MGRPGRCSSAWRTIIGAILLLLISSSAAALDAAQPRASQQEAGVAAAVPQGYRLCPDGFQPCKCEWPHHKDRRGYAERGEYGRQEAYTHLEPSSTRTRGKRFCCCPSQDLCANVDCNPAPVCQAGVCDPSTGSCTTTPLTGPSCLPLPDVASATCSAGQCVIGACLPGWVNCGSNSTTGCETPQSVTQCGCSATNCITTVVNAAGVTCTPVTPTSSVCDYATCNSGFLNCDGIRANGCETAESVESCGCSGINCTSTVLNAAGITCTAGACDYTTCLTGWYNCVSDRTSGCRSVSAVPIPSYTNYTVPPASEPFVDACSLPGATTMQFVDSYDDGTTNITLPFPFTLYNATTTDAWVSTNGALGVGSTPTADYTTVCPFPSDGIDAKNAIFAFLDDLYVLDTSAVCTATTGTAPNRRFIVTWSNVVLYNDNTQPEGASLNFSVYLEETTNLFYVAYGPMTSVEYPDEANGSGGAIGVQNADGSVGTQFSCETEVAGGLSNTTIVFTPPAAC